MAEDREGQERRIAENGSPGTQQAPSARRPFVEPRLRFVEPKLVKHGDVTRVTAGFFGTFSP